jgi:hypothetical protein
VSPILQPTSSSLKLWKNVLNSPKTADRMLQEAYNEHLKSFGRGKDAEYQLLTQYQTNLNQECTTHIKYSTKNRSTQKNSRIRTELKDRLHFFQKYQVRKIQKYEYNQEEKLATGSTKKRPKKKRKGPPIIHRRQTRRDIPLVIEGDNHNPQSHFGPSLFTEPDRIAPDAPALDDTLQGKEHAAVDRPTITGRQWGNAGERWNPSTHRRPNSTG